MLHLSHSMYSAVLHYIAYALCIYTHTVAPAHLYSDHSRNIVRLCNTTILWKDKYSFCKTKYLVGSIHSTLGSVRIYWLLREAKNKPARICVIWIQWDWILCVIAYIERVCLRTLEICCKYRRHMCAYTRVLLSVCTASRRGALGPLCWEREQSWGTGERTVIKLALFYPIPGCCYCFRAFEEETYSFSFQNEWL